MLKTLVKLTFGIAALAAATSFGTSTGRAFGDAPWCAVIMADRAFATPPYIRGWGAYPALFSGIPPFCVHVLIPTAE